MRSEGRLGVLLANQQWDAKCLHTATNPVAIMGTVARGDRAKAHYGHVHLRGTPESGD